MRTKYLKSQSHFVVSEIAATNPGEIGADGSAGKANNDFERVKMEKKRSEVVAKVPQITLAFWIIKILATTLGETGGDAVTMSWLGETTAAARGTGYLIGTSIFGVIFVAAVLVQIKAKRFHPSLYWLTIVATTTVGTTLADYCTR